MRDECGLIVTLPNPFIPSKGTICERTLISEENDVVLERNVIESWQSPSDAAAAAADADATV